MQTKRVIGIDFGTSTTVVRVKRYEDIGKPVGDKYYTDNLLFDGKDYVPTLVQIPDDEIITSELELSEEDCEFGHYAAVEQPGMKIYRNFKVDLESEDEEDRMRAKWLTEHFFRYIGQEYKNQKNQLGSSHDEEITFVSYPAKYGEDTRMFLVAAAQKAGFQNVKGITEPEAAVKAIVVRDEEELKRIGFFDRTKSVYILLIDMGAGTTDLAVCKYTNGKTKIVSTWPDKNTNIYFGGKEVDELLCKYIENYLRQNSSIVPDYFINSFSEKYMDTIKIWKETTVSRALKRGRNVPSFQYIKNIYPSIPDFTPAIDKDILERYCCDYLKSFSELVTGCIESTKKKDTDFVSDESIELVILTGGHSQWYFIEDIIQGKKTEVGKIKLQKIQEDITRVHRNGKPQETVAVGMAYLLQEQTIVEPENKNRIDELESITEDMGRTEKKEEDYNDTKETPLIELECAGGPEVLGETIRFYKIIKCYRNRLVLNGSGEIIIYYSEISRFRRVRGTPNSTTLNAKLLLSGKNPKDLKPRWWDFTRPVIRIEIGIWIYNISFDSPGAATDVYNILKRYVKC